MIGVCTGMGDDWTLSNGCRCPCHFDPNMRHVIACCQPRYIHGKIPIIDIDPDTMEARKDDPIS